MNTHPHCRRSIVHGESRLLFFASGPEAGGAEKNSSRDRPSGEVLKDDIIASKDARIAQVRKAIAAESATDVKRALEKRIVQTRNGNTHSGMHSASSPENAPQLKNVRFPEKLVNGIRILTTFKTGLIQAEWSDESKPVQLLLNEKKWELFSEGGDANSAPAQKVILQSVDNPSITISFDVDALFHPQKGFLASKIFDEAELALQSFKQNPVMPPVTPPNVPPTPPTTEPKIPTPQPPEPPSKVVDPNTLERATDEIAKEFITRLDIDRENFKRLREQAPKALIAVQREIDTRTSGDPRRSQLEEWRKAIQENIDLLGKVDRLIDIREHVDGFMAKKEWNQGDTASAIAQIGDEIQLRKEIGYDKTFPARMQQLAMWKARLESGQTPDGRDTSNTARNKLEQQKISIRNTTDDLAKRFAKDLSIDDDNYRLLTEGVQKASEAIATERAFVVGNNFIMDANRTGQLDRWKATLEQNMQFLKDYPEVVRLRDTVNERMQDLSKSGTDKNSVLNLIDNELNVRARTGFGSPKREADLRMWRENIQKGKAPDGTETTETATRITLAKSALETADKKTAMTSLLRAVGVESEFQALLGRRFTVTQSWTDSSDISVKGDIPNVAGGIWLRDERTNTLFRVPMNVNLRDPLASLTRIQKALESHAAEVDDPKKFYEKWKRVSREKFNEEPPKPAINFSTKLETVMKNTSTKKEGGDVRVSWPKTSEPVTVRIEGPNGKTESWEMFSDFVMTGDNETHAGGVVLRSKENKDRVALFKEGALLTAANALQFLKDRATDATNFAVSQEKDAAGIKNFDLVKKGQKMGYICLWDKQDPGLFSKSGMSTTNFPKVLQQKYGKDRLADDAIRIRDGRDADPLSLLRSEVDAMHEKGIKNFYIPIVAHGSKYGMSFGANLLTPAHIQSLVREYPDCTFTFRIDSCYNGNMADMMMGFQDAQDAPKGRVTVFNLGKNDMTTTFLDSEASYNAYLTQYLLEGLSYGEAHLKADKKAKEMTYRDAEVWSSNPEAPSDRTANVENRTDARLRTERDRNA